MSMFVFPVSAVMKFWHWLLADMLGLAADTAWVVSIILLVVTVRTIIAPFSWSTIKSARMTILMRPEIKELEARYRLSTDPDDVAAFDEKRKEINKKYGYNPLAGCVPPLIQIPAILGLYRLLLWMSVPENGHAGGSIGLLTSDDVASFLDSRFMGVPLPAYMSMTQEQFLTLGTTADDVRGVAVPLLVCAIVFTTFNMVLSQIRTHTTMDWELKLTRGVYWLIWIVTAFVPVFLIMAAMTGKIPIALLLYWFCGNLWTLAQTIVLWVAVVKKYPLEEHHIEHIGSVRAQVRRDSRERRRTERAWRRRRLSSLTSPGSVGQVHREIKGEKRQAKELASAEKAETKAAAKQQARVRSERRKQEMEKRKAERQEARREKSDPKGADGAAVDKQE